MLNATAVFLNDVLMLVLMFSENQHLVPNLKLMYLFKLFFLQTLLTFLLFFFFRNYQPFLHITVQTGSRLVPFSTKWQSSSKIKNWSKITDGMKTNHSAVLLLFLYFVNIKLSQLTYHCVAYCFITEEVYSSSKKQQQFIKQQR